MNREVKVQLNRIVQKGMMLFIWSCIAFSFISTPLLAQTPKVVFRLGGMDESKIGWMVQDRSLKKFERYWADSKRKDPQYLQIYMIQLFYESAQVGWEEGIAFALAGGIPNAVVRGEIEYGINSGKLQRIERLRRLVKDKKVIQESLAWLLYYKVRYQNVEDVKLLLKLGADPNYIISPEVEESVWPPSELKNHHDIFKSGCGPVYHRAKPKMRIILLAAGADPNAKDCAGRTPEEYDKVKEEDMKAWYKKSKPKIGIE